MERTQERELGMVADLLEKGKSQSAQRMLRYMLRKDPQNVAIWWVMAQVAPPPQALDAVAEILRLSPHHEGARRLQAHLHQQAIESTPDRFGERHIYLCPACAAQFALINAANCPFCQSLLQPSIAEDEETPDQILPFSYNRERAAAFVLQWLKNSWLLPPRIKYIFKPNWLTPIYVPFWRINAHLAGEWQAPTGEKGHISADVKDLLYSASAHLTEQQWHRVLNYQLEQSVPYSAAETKAIGLHLPAIHYEQALLPVRAAVLDALHQQNPDLHDPELDVTLHHESESWDLLLLPVYIMSYSYGGKRYQVLVNGQTGELAGGRPVEWLRAGLYMLVLLAPGLILSLLAGSTKVAGALLLPLLFLLGGLVLVGFVLNEAFSYD